MEPGIVLVKTPKGQEEIEKRTHKLPGRLRAVLFMIDGQRSVGELLEQAGGLADQLAQQLEELRTLGHVTALAPTASGSASTQSAQTNNSSSPAVSGAAAPTPPDWTKTSLEVLKAKLNKVLTDSMGMRATFLIAQVNNIPNHASLAQFIDDTAHGMASASGPGTADNWRRATRAAMGMPAAD